MLQDPGLGGRLATVTMHCTEHKPSLLFQFATPATVGTCGSLSCTATCLQLQHQVHSLFPQRVDVIEDQGGDDVNAIGLVGGDAVLSKHTHTGTHTVINRPSRASRLRGEFNSGLATPSHVSGDSCKFSVRKW